MPWERYKRNWQFGIKNLKKFHETSPLELIWMLATNPNSKWAKTMKQQYFPNSSILQANIKNSCSQAWRNKAKKTKNSFTFSEAIKRQLGEGQMSFWYDNWCGQSPLAHYFRSFPPNINQNVLVNDLKLKEVLATPWSIHVCLEHGDQAKLEISKLRMPPRYTAYHQRLKWYFSSSAKVLTLESKLIT